MRKIIVLLLVVVLGVGLFSCSQSQENDDVISIFRWDFAAINSARKKQTPLYKNIKEKIGADIEVVTCGYADWESVLNNRFNTSTLPDVFVNYAIDRPETFSKWIQNGSVLAISDYVSETEYPNIYNKLQQYTYLLDRIEYLDGKFYALPIDIKMTHGMFVRVDWINNLNKPEKLRTILTDELGRAPTDDEMESMKFTTPTTLLEFYRLAKAFSLYDPDENGRRDTYGYSSSNSLMWYNNWIFEAYDSTFFGMVEDGKGGLTSSWITQGNKNAVAFLNKLYNEGILDPDYIAVTDSQKIENFCQGRIGIMVDNIYYNNIIEQFKNANAVTREQAMEDVAVITPPAGGGAAMIEEYSKEAIKYLR